MMSPFRKVAADDGVLVQLQERARDFLEVGELLQFVDVDRFAGQHGLDDALVGERAGGAGHHAFAAGHARGIAHRQVVVEGDAGPETFAAAAEHVVVADLVAAANAAVAQDAGFVIDGDDERRIVLAARRQAAREARLGDAFQARQGFKFAVARLALAGAGAGMVRHQQFDQRAARAHDLFGIGGDHHLLFGGAHAGRGQNAAA